MKEDFPKHRLPLQHCPFCGCKLDAATGVTSDKKPRPGDFSVCINCATVLRYGEVLDLKLVNPEELQLLKPEDLRGLSKAQDVIRMRNSKPGAEYMKQVEDMAKRAREWRNRNPEAAVKVQFNWPPDIGVIAPISDAIRARIVTVNSEGLQLIKSLWPWDQRDEPTIFMVKLALDLSEKLP